MYLVRVYSVEVKSSVEPYHQANQYSAMPQKALGARGRQVPSLVRPVNAFEANLLHTIVSYVKYV